MARAKRAARTGKPKAWNETKSVEAFIAAMRRRERLSKAFKPFYPEPRKNAPPAVVRAFDEACEDEDRIRASVPPSKLTRFDERVIGRIFGQNECHQRAARLFLEQVVPYVSYSIRRLVYGYGTGHRDDPAVQAVVKAAYDASGQLEQLCAQHKLLLRELDEYDVDLVGQLDGISKMKLISDLRETGVEFGDRRLKLTAADAAAAADVNRNYGNSVKNRQKTGRSQ